MDTSVHETNTVMFKMHTDIFLGILLTEWNNVTMKWSGGQKVLLKLSMWW